MLARGCLTLLTSQWKSGKTTLLAHLLAKMETGQPFAGLPVQQGRALIISEESQALWFERARKLGLKDHRLTCRPFEGIPDRAQWRQLLQYIENLHDELDLGLVVIDPLIMFFPSYTEIDAASAAQSLAELRAVADRGLAVLILHHPKKGETREGQAARGIGALNAQVDIVLEMSYFSNPASGDRRRQIVAFSRFEETPRRLLLELKPDGSDYTVLTPQAAGEHGVILLDLLRQAIAPVTAASLRARWPDSHTRPDLTTLRRWLARLTEQGLIVQEGNGRKNAPYRYAVREGER